MRLSVLLIPGSSIPTVFIAVAGRSNGLGPVLAGNASWPVISCPPVKADWGSQDIWSSMRLPSGRSPWVEMSDAIIVMRNLPSIPNLNTHWGNLFYLLSSNLRLTFLIAQIYIFSRLRLHYHPGCWRSRHRCSEDIRLDKSPRVGKTTICKTESAN